MTPALDVDLLADFILGKIESAEYQGLHPELASMGLAIAIREWADANAPQASGVGRLAEAYHDYRLQFYSGGLYCGSESGPFEFASGPCSCRMDMDGVIRLLGQSSDG